MSKRSKSKTLAAWLALIGGTLGWHRFYLYGFGDWLGWLLPIPTALGVWGVERAKTQGLDDVLSWLLIPLLGFSVTAACLTAIVYALSDAPRWNSRHNPNAPESPAGNTHWLTIGAVVLSLLLGTGALMSSLALSFQRYFEFQIQEAQKISQQP